MRFLYTDLNLFHHRDTEISCGFNFGWSPHIRKTTHPHPRRSALRFRSNPTRRAKQNRGSPLKKALVSEVRTKGDGYRTITVFDAAGKPHLWARNGLASMRVCLIASRLAVNRIFLRHPPRTKKFITRQIDHAFANHDGLGRQILKECPIPFVPNTLARTPISQVAL